MSKANDRLRGAAMESGGLVCSCCHRKLNSCSCLLFI